MSTVTFLWPHNVLQALSIQRVKSEVSFFKCKFKVNPFFRPVSVICSLFIQWVQVNLDITQHKHMKVRSGATN